jgi:hypothetical protein
MMRAWRATFVRRWHPNPDICHTVDPIGWHSARMGVMALHFWPDASRELLIACLCHDLGESGPGDAPPSAKSDHEFRAACERLECEALAEMGFLSTMTQLQSLDRSRLRYLDRLDAYLWARHHAPHVLAQDDWRESLAWLQREADTLNIKDQPL